MNDGRKINNTMATGLYGQIMPNISNQLSESCPSIKKIEIYFVYTSASEHQSFGIRPPRFGQPACDSLYRSWAQTISAP